MKNVLESFLDTSAEISVNDFRWALRQLTQEIVLLGLWRGKFFEHASFYGGTALRIVYLLDRFSEDLDFSLDRKDPDFSLSSYFPYVIRELEAFGFEAEIRRIEKARESQIESAFVKMGTRSVSIVLQAPQPMIRTFAKNESLKIKFEIDTDPPAGFLTEAKFLYRPQPFSVRVFDAGSMFAGKLHSIIARVWKKRIKGRDWYDVAWFISRSIPARLGHFRERLIQTGHLAFEAEFQEKDAFVMLLQRCEEVDFKAAAEDVRPFLRDNSVLSLWSRDFFVNTINRIRFVST